MAKLPSDRDALVKAAVRGKSKFFLGTDSAPHDVKSKKGGKGKTAAGVFTQPYAVQACIGGLEDAVDRGAIAAEEVTAEVLEGFLGGYGRKFYGLESKTKPTIVLRKGDEVVQESFTGDEVEVVPFRRGKNTWTVEWK